MHRITEHRHGILTGATGTGKTWIACALGNQAAREGFSVLYTRLSRLLDDIATARLGSGAGALMRRLARVDLLILDDWMMSELTATQRRDLMEIVDDRHDRGSIILASQIPLPAGIGRSGIPLIPRRYWTASFTSPIGLNSRATPCENPLVVAPPLPAAPSINPLPTSGKQP